MVALQLGLQHLAVELAVGAVEDGAQGQHRARPHGVEGLLVVAPVVVGQRHRHVGQGHRDNGGEEQTAEATMAEQAGHPTVIPRES